MIHTIENEFLQVQANEAGAELWSIRSKKTGVEYLWQGDENFWGGRAYNLFPFIGRMPDKIFTYEGKTYDANTHGLARYATFLLEKKTGSSLTFLFKDDENTKKEFPFSFEFRVSFILEGSSVITKFEVTNTDDKTMLCSFGGHPGINVPFGKGAFEDYYLDFEKATPARRQLLDDTQPFMADKTVDYPFVDGTKLPLRHDLFDNDAIILENTSGSVCIRCDKEERFVRMTYGEYPFIGIWQVYKEGAPYICLEPWSALPGIVGQRVELEKKPYMTSVAAGNKKDICFTLEIHE